MKRKQIASLLLSSLLSISIACAPFASLNVLATENAIAADETVMEEEQQEESAESDIGETVVNEQAESENMIDGIEDLDQAESITKPSDDNVVTDEEINDLEVSDSENQDLVEQSGDASTTYQEASELDEENDNNEYGTDNNTAGTAEESIAEEIIATEEANEAKLADADSSIDSGYCGDNVTWELSGLENDYTLTISGVGSMYDFSEEDMPWSPYRSGITSVEVEEGIAVLGSYSFYSLTNLVQVSLPETLEAINDHCFADCFSLSKISIPKNVTVIRDSAFEGCGLTELNYSGTESEWHSIEIGQGNEILSIINFQTITEVTPIVELSKNSFVYNGKVQKPELVVKVEEKTIAADDYSIEFSGDCINVGTYKVTVSMKGSYSGKKTLSYKITAKKVTPTVTLAKSVYAYTGSNIKPAATVKTGKTVLKKNQDYIVTYPKACRNVGTYKAVVKLKGNYSGTKAVTYKINPKATRLHSVVGTKDKFIVKWFKQEEQVTGYQIQYSLKSDFSSGNKTVTIKKNSINVTTIKKPVVGKNYFVRVRSYKTASGKNYYSPWSSAISSVTQRTLQKRNTVTLRENNGSFTYRFRISNRMITMAPIKIRVTGTYISKGGFRIILEDSNGKTWQNDYVNLKEYENGDEFETWFYNDGGILPPGDYYYTLKNTSDDTIKVTYSTFGYSKKAATANIRKSVSTSSGSWVKLGRITDGLPLVKSIKCVGSNIIDGWDVEYDGTVYVWAEKKGTSDVVITLASGKKYTTKLNVTAGNPDFMAYVNGYYTRDNYFTVKIKNLRGSDLTIVREGGKVENYDYKSFDRWINNNGNVTIKSGETKTVRFYLKGTPTYPDYTKFDLHAKFIFEGKTYVWHVWRNDSAFKKNNGWYNTYWDDEAYDEWY